MKNETKAELTYFIEGIPPQKRKLNPDYCQPNDFKRLIKVSVALLKNDDSMDEFDIKLICEDVGGAEYSDLVKNPLFIEEFARPILSEIDSAKNVISAYREL